LKERSRACSIAVAVFVPPGSDLTIVKNIFLRFSWYCAPQIVGE